MFLITQKIIASITDLQLELHYVSNLFSSNFYLSLLEKGCSNKKEILIIVYTKHGLCMLCILYESFVSIYFKKANNNEN